MDGTAYYYVAALHADLPNNDIVDRNIIYILHDLTPGTTGDFQSSPFPASDNAIVGNSCSPVSIQLFNSGGQMIGLDSNGTLRQDIPNSVFVEFTNNESFILPAQGTYTATLRAKGNGTFSLVFHSVTPQGAIVATFGFTDVPISINARAQMVLNPTTLAQSLRLDVNGDGSLIYTVQSNQPVPVAAFVSTLLNIVASFNLTNGLTIDLSSVLNAALGSLKGGDNTAARNQLAAFENKVAAQTTKGLTTGQAAVLTNVADKAISLLR